MAAALATPLLSLYRICAVLRRGEAVAISAEEQLQIRTALEQLSGIAVELVAALTVSTPSGSLSPSKVEKLIDNWNGCFVIIYRGWADAARANRIYEECRAVCTQQHEIVMWGKSMLQPRLNWACADAHIREHKYSSAKGIPTANWTPELKSVRDDAYRQFQIYLDSCLLNGYRNGQDSVGWHNDKELRDPNKTVMTLSTRATRRFDYRIKATHEKLISTYLHHGDLLFMYGATNELLEHQIPKEAKVTGDRFSATFRVLSELTLQAQMK